MSERMLRVAIIGGGLAGPCLAHALLRSGAQVSLYERDPGFASRGQGYRIQVAPEGIHALRSCLPPHLYQLAVATSGKCGSAETVLSSQLEVLHRITFEGPAQDDGSAGISVDRQTFRRVLLAGLEATVRFGASFTHYESLADGSVRAHFADGSMADADVLVAADGAGSRVRAQLLPQASVVETGQLLIFGKTYLTEEVRRLTPAPALDGFSTIVGSGGRLLPLAGFEYRSDPAVVASAYAPGLAFEDTRDYVMWVLGAPAEAFGVPAPQLFQLDGRSLLDTAAGLITDWHPNVVEVVRRGDPATVSATSVRTCQRLGHWRTGPVTLIGDAIHCMVPAGMGAAVALRDAALLAERLGEVAGAAKPLQEAVKEYETEMLEYGLAAVAASLSHPNSLRQAAGPISEHESEGRDPGPPPAYRGPGPRAPNDGR